MGKVLFFDVDGTLSDFTGSMPASAEEGLRLARANGHKVIICTGRSTYQIAPFLRSVSDGLVASTGCYVSSGEKVVYEHFMPMETICRVLEVMKPTGAAVNGQGEDGLVLSPLGLQRMEERLKNALPWRRQTLLSNYKLSEDPEDYRGIKKFVYNGSSLTVEQIAEQLGDICDVTASSFSEDDIGGGEITCRGINKATGMQRYLDTVGVKREDSFAFGDGPNDFEMLDFAGVGIAMGSGREELKRRADYVTTDLQDDGIYNALKHFNLI